MEFTTVGLDPIFVLTMGVREDQKRVTGAVAFLQFGQRKMTIGLMKVHGR